MVTKTLEFADDVQLEDFPTREGLGYRERKEAEFLRTMARGVMLVTGQPGSGKDLFGSSVAWLNKYYFGRRILLDFIPKRPFGKYTLFNAKVMMQEINKMAKAAGTDAIAEAKNGLDDKMVDDIAKRWVEEQGETLLKGSVLYLSELKRYCYNRNPHNPFNKFIGSICTVWRHLDLLVIGTHVQAHEIDRFSFLEYVTHRAKCSWSLSRPNTTDVRVSRGAYIGVNNVYDVTAKDVVVHVDGKKPRSILNGKGFFDLYPTKNMVNLKPVVRREL